MLVLILLVMELGPGGHGVFVVAGWHVGVTLILKF
jgi:hypothetical protein